MTNETSPKCKTCGKTSYYPRPDLWYRLTQTDRTTPGIPGFRLIGWFCTWGCVQKFKDQP